MRQGPIISAALIAAAAALAAPVASAETVHRWVDEDGVTHFSDTPPAAAGAAPEVETLSLPADFPEAEDTEATYYSVANQWQRMKAERAAKEERALERERLRTERAAAREAAAAAAASAAAANRPPVVVGGGAHRPLPGFAHGRRGFGHRGAGGHRGVHPAFDSGFGLRLKLGHDRGGHHRAHGGRGHHGRQGGGQHAVPEPRSRVGNNPLRR